MCLDVSVYFYFKFSIVFESERDVRSCEVT